MTKKEKIIVNIILKELRKQGFFVHKTWGNLYECAGRADISGITPDDGRRVEIEVKNERGKLSKEQMIWLQVMAAHGAIASACDEPASALKMMLCPNCDELGCGNICFYCGRRKNEKRYK